MYSSRAWRFNEYFKFQSSYFGIFQSFLTSKTVLVYFYKLMKAFFVQTKYI